MRILAVACIAVLASACVERQARETPSILNDQASSIVLDGAIHIPVAVGPLGCVLYRIEIPGGRAPAALVYRSCDGSFSYARPERCEEADEGR